MHASEPLHVVSVLNVSNPQQLDSDSGYITQVLFGQELLRRGHQFCLVAPLGGQATVPCQYLKLGESKYEVRFGFPYAAFRKVLKQMLAKWGRIDWIWVNQPETMTAVHAVKQELGLAGTKIFVYVHYLPVLKFCSSVGARGGGGEMEWAWDPSLNDGQLALPVMRRVAEGCQQADAVGIHAQFGKEMLAGVAGAIGLPLDSNKIHVIPSATDPFLVSCESSKFPRASPLLFGYPNRLYAHYGTAEMFAHFGRLCQQWGAKVWVTNPTRRRSAVRKGLDSESASVEEAVLAREFVVQFPAVPSRPEYRRWLLRSAINFGPNRQAALWSLSVIDGMGLGVPSLAPAAGAFPEILPPQCLFGDAADLDFKVQRLLEDEDLWVATAEESRARARRYLPVNQVTQLESLLWSVKDHGQTEIPASRTVIVS